MAALTSGCDGCQSNTGDRIVDPVVVDPPLPSPCTPDPDTSALVGMTTSIQIETNWCWAACGQMTMKFVGDTTIEQCVQADSLLERADCCDRDNPDDCNSVGFIEFGKHGFTADSIPQALTWEQIQEQIGCKGSPICAVRKFRHRNSAHMVVASGYTTAGGERQVLIRNPAQDFSTRPAYLIPYHFLDENPFEQYDSTTWYVHEKDIFNIRKKQRE